MYFLLGLVFLIPFQTHPLLSSSIGPKITPIKMMGILCVVAALFEMLKSRKKSSHEGLQAQGKLFLAFAISQMFLGVVWIGETGDDAMRSLVSFLIFFFSCLYLVKSEKDINLILWGCLFSMAWSSLYMYKEYFTLRHVFTGFRPRGSFGDSNYFSIAAVMVLPMGIALWNSSRGFAKKISMVLILMISGGLLVSQSRGGLLGVGVVSLLYILNARNKVRAISIFAVLGLVVFLIMPENYKERLQNVKVEDSVDVAGDELSNKRRIELPRSGWLMFRANPVFGVGPGNFKQNSVVYNPILEDLNGAGIAHNTYLEILGETGVFGSLLFILINIFTIRTLNRIIRRLPEVSMLFHAARALKISLYGFFISAFFLSAQYSKYYWLAVFLSMVLHRIASEKIQALLRMPGDVTRLEGAIS